MRKSRGEQVGLARIPEHLAHLKRDPITNLPVPWSTRWVPAEGKPHAEHVRHDQAVHDLAAFYPDDLEGVPDWQHWSPQRQRASFIYGLCGVCRRPLAWGARNVVVSSDSIQVVDLAAKMVPSVTEPWVCPDCARFAMHWCPELVRRHRGQDLKIVPVNGAEECQLMSVRRMASTAVEMVLPVIGEMRLVLFSLELEIPEPP